MTKFSDQLFDDLMREHGPSLARSRPAAVPKRHPAVRRTLLAAGAGSVAVAATVSALVAGGGTPAYAVTTHPDGTVTLAVYQKAGITGINTKLRQIGDDQVVVVPVEAGCPSLGSLPTPAVPAGGHIAIQTGASVEGGTVTVHAKGIPAGDILVVGFETTSHGNVTSGLGGARLTTAPAPSCVSLPTGPPPGSGGSVSGG